MIKISNIHKSFQDGEGRLNHVLRGVDMVVEKGMFVAIKGPSGSGKTTLLSILGTLLQPDTGSYLLNGKDMIVTDIDYASIRNKHIGFVFQDHRLLPQFTALENILLPTLANSPQASKETVDYACQLLALTQIANLANHYSNTLSGGEATRVALCRALIMKPLLLLADEPTGQLDADLSKNTALLLSSVNKNLQTTIVMVTHSDDTASAAHRAFNLKKGILTISTS